MNATQMLQSIRKLNASLYGKDFLLTWDKSLPELKLILQTAELMKHLYEQNISLRVFDTGLAISNFRDNSTRTRFSFASASNLLGLAVQDLDEGKSQIAHGETVRETANMISFLTQIIGIRDDMYLGAGHTYMLEVAEALEDGFNQGVLAQRPGIVNLQCDIDHPTQSMADLCWLKEHFGSLDALRGKKIAMTWAYSPSYGKPLSVPQGIIGLMTRFGMDVTLAHPPGYDLIPDVVDLAGRQARETGGSFRQVTSMEEAFEGADIVYPKSWAPYQVMQKRTDLLRAKDQDGLKELEKQCLAHNAEYKNWECDEAKMKRTKGGEALYMHCLPADITDVSCKAGEVSASVFEKYRIPTYKEAGYKPFVIAAMMLTNRMEDVTGTLGELMGYPMERVLDVSALPPVSGAKKAKKPAKKAKKPAAKKTAKKAPAKKAVKKAAVKKAPKKAAARKPAKKKARKAKR
ncbi:MAG TPA: knotted carbamoyltransferase YgeW [Kiritimatiellia bacterium]|nr:knotted carbamoyltransferase YgeW [Kiritimatiellia bacterium]HPJ56609.1 knotted carbamoyltransferase YgeW [Kiritimatiellia bacterium]HPR69473.1 knotted carbamoyltransferase YgeW [Kiritimatiellia bacterium]